MDQDLLKYLDQRFSAIDQRFNEVNRRFDKIDERFEGVDQRFSEVDQRFQETGQQIQVVREGTAQQIQALREENAGNFREVDQRFDRLETEVRGAWISIEDLRGQVKLVAEGVSNNSERLDRHAEEVSRRFDDLESLLRLYINQPARSRRSRSGSPP